MSGVNGGRTLDPQRILKELEEPLPQATEDRASGLAWTRRFAEGEGKEGGDAKAGEGYEVVPGEFLLEKENREHDEHRDGDHLLNDLELKS